MKSFMKWTPGRVLNNSSVKKNWSERWTAKKLNNAIALGPSAEIGMLNCNLNLEPNFFKSKYFSDIMDNWDVIYDLFKVRYIDTKQFFL